MAWACSRFQSGTLTLTDTRAGPLDLLEQVESRSISGDLVMIPTGLRYSAQTSRHPRVSGSSLPSRLVAVVTPEKTTSSPFHDRRSNGLAEGLGASGFTVIFRRVGAGAEARYSCVGRA